MRKKLPKTPFERYCDTVVEELLQSRRASYDSLSEAEKHDVRKWLRESVASGKVDNAIYKTIWEEDYIRKPVDVRTFVKDPYFLGKYAGDLSDRWLADLELVFGFESRVIEWFMTGSIGCGKCCIAGTLIPTGTGLRAIENVRVGEYVQSESGFRKVTTVHDEGVTDTVRLTTVKGNVFEARPNHRIRVLASDLTLAWKKMSELRLGDVVVRQASTPALAAGKLSESEAFYELLGWYAAEGSISGNRVLFSLHADELPYVLKLVLNAWRSRCESAHACREHSHVSVSRPCGELLDVLREIGTVSEQKRIPRCVLRSGAVGIAAFLRGYFSGDGTAGKSGSVSVTTVSPTMASHVAVALTYLGIDSTTSTKIPTYRYGRRQLNGQRAYTVSVIGYASAAKFAASIGFVGAHKQDRLLARLCRRSTNGNGHRHALRISKPVAAKLRAAQPSFNRGTAPTGITKTTSPRGLLHRVAVSGQRFTSELGAAILGAGGVLPTVLEKFATGEYFIDHVAATEKRRAHCYDLTVEDDPSYVSDGFISHNTTCATIALAYKLYQLSCLRSPNTYYGLLPNSRLYFGIYSITKKQVADTGYSKLRTFLENSPFFIEECPFDRRLETKIAFQSTPITVLSGCVATGTLVETPRGTVPIESVAAGGVVVSTTKESTVCAATTPGAVYSGDKPCLEVRTDENRVECSADHRFAVLHRGRVSYRRADELRPGEKVLTMRRREASDRRVLQRRVEVQDVRQSEQLGALLQESNGERQESGESDRSEALFEMQDCEASGMLWEESSISGKRSEDLHQVLLQAMRECGNQSVCLEEQSGDRPQSERVQRPFRYQATQRQTLAEVLREASRASEGYGESVCCEIVFGWKEEGLQKEYAPRFGDGIPVEPKSDAGAVHSVSKDASRAGRQEQGRNEAESAEERHRFYLVGCRHHDTSGVFWRVRLLWSTPIDCKVDAGTSYSSFERRADDARQLCAGVQDLQFDETGPLRDVVDAAVVASSRRTEVSPVAIETHQVVVATVRSIRDAGVKATYDLTGVVSPTHSFVAGGFVVSNSRNLHAIGLDMYSSSIDESNFMQAKVNEETGRMAGQAYELHDSVKTRLKSRFMRPGGTIPGILLLMSSRNLTTSFLERKLLEANPSYRFGDKGLIDDAGTVFLSDYCLWDIKPEKFKREKTKWFKVEVGDRTANSRILLPDEPPRAGALVREIPEDFRDDFERNVDQALRDIAGTPTLNVSPLIYDRGSIDAAVVPSLAHPFTKEMLTLYPNPPRNAADVVPVVVSRARKPAHAGDGVHDDIELSAYFSAAKVCRIDNGRWVPKINPFAPRFIHFDLSLSGDCCGLAMVHRGGIHRFTATNEDGTFDVIERNLYMVDMMLRIWPPKGTQIPLAKLLRFVRFLRGIYPVQAVTFDGFQSAYLFQQVKMEGMESAIVSMDKTELPYLNLVANLSDRCLLMYDYAPVKDELIDLHRNVDTRKVDHPDISSRTGEKGRKDVSDALTGALWQCSRSPVSEYTPFVDRQALSGAGTTDATAIDNAVITGTPVLTKLKTQRGEIDWKDLQANAE